MGSLPVFRCQPYALCRFIGVLIICVLRLGSAGDAAVDWPVLHFAPIVTNRFDSPTCIATVDDRSARIFAAERKGKVWAIQNGAVSSTPFLDLSSVVATKGSEQGLLGLAFPPGF